MRGFGKCSVWLGAALAFVCGALMLLPTEAAAQFNIEGLIRGAMSHGGGGYRYHSYSRHSSRHESSRHARREKEDESEKSSEKNSDKGKEKDATQAESASANAPARQPASAPSHDVGRSDQPDTSSAKPSNNGAPSDDQPKFNPSR